MLYFPKFMMCAFLIFAYVGADARDIASFLPEFEAYAEKARQECQAVGMAIAIVKEGKLIYAKGFGKRGLEDAQPVTVDTLFQIGSMSKSCTTALTALAVDRKHLRWEDEVMRYVPSFVLYDPWVTRAFQIEDLYAQRSGLVPYEGDIQALLGVSVPEMIGHLQFFPPVTSFRSTFGYQNIFFAVGATALGKATGTPWPKLIESELFRPLEMNNSSTGLASYLKNTNRVQWHVRRADGTVKLIPDNVDIADWVYIYEAAGGVNSTILDMAKWIMFQTDLGKQRGRQMISQENLRRTHRPHVYLGTLHGSTNYYCLGWIFQDYSPYPIIWHNGATSGVNNNMAIIPEERLGIVILCNTRDTVAAEALTMKFFDMYYDKPPVDWLQLFFGYQKAAQKASDGQEEVISKALPSLNLEDYTGVYTNPVYKEIVVSRQGNDLQVEIGPRKTKWILKHFNRDTFSFYWPFVDDGTTKVTFCLNPENKPEKMIFEILQDENMGVFTKKKK